MQMIMEDKKIVTIDLGTQKLGVSIAEQGENGKIRLLCYNEFPSDGISHGKVLNPSKLGNSLKAALENSERFLKLKVNEVMVNVQKYDIREIKVDAAIDVGGKCITADDIAFLEDNIWENAKMQAESSEDIFGIVPQSFDADGEWGVGTSDIVGMMADMLTGHYVAYAGRNSCRNNISAAFAAAGIQKANPVFVPGKIGESVLTTSEMEGGVALMDIGAGGSSVSVFMHGSLRHYGAIPFGGNNITTDIKNLCGIDEKLAENIKLGYGGLMPEKLATLGEKTLKITDITSGDKIEITAKYLSEIITARMREILEALLYEIQQSGYADKLKNGIVVCGGCANTLNLCSMIKEISGYNARIGAPSRKLFDADRAFFTAPAAVSAGLNLHFMGGSTNSCTEAVEEEPEPEISLADMFGKAQEEDKDDKKRRQAEEKERKEREKAAEKERKEREKAEKMREKAEKQRAKEEERRGFSLFGAFNEVLFGSDEDPENKI